MELGRSPKAQCVIRRQNELDTQSACATMSMMAREPSGVDTSLASGEFVIHVLSRLFSSGKGQGQGVIA